MLTTIEGTDSSSLDDFIHARANEGRPARLISLWDRRIARGSRRALSFFLQPQRMLRWCFRGPYLRLRESQAGRHRWTTPFGHAHELLVGYALAVVAGNQLGVLPAWRLRLLLAGWILARVAFVTLPGPIASALDIAFVAALGLHVAPRLFRAAKKLRNQALPAILTALRAPERYAHGVTRRHC